MRFVDEKGSSPRVRGRPTQPHGRPPHHRAHPRVCGADGAALMQAVAPTGSSPRVRGRRLSAETDSSRATAHPRVCGTDFRHRVAEVGVRGLIPACAGQTVMRGIIRRRFRAHPRVCGADRGWASRRALPPGSSPCVRGRPDPGETRVIPSGLIPVCAGQTRPGRDASYSEWAHPRVCGADDSAAWRFARASGSSPRVRGRPSRRFFPAPRPGLIPACAGQTNARAV